MNGGEEHIPRKDRANGVWHTKKQKGAKRQHKGTGGGRKRHQYTATEPQRRDRGK